MTYQFIGAFLKKPKRDNHVLKSFVITVILISQILAVYFLANGFVISILSIVGAFLIANFCFKAKIYGAGIAAFFSFLAGASSELLAAFIITSFQDIPIYYMAELNTYRLQARTLSILILILFVVLIRHFRVGKFGVMTLKVVLVLSILPIASIIFIQYFVIHIMTVSYVPSIAEIASIFNIIIVNIFLFVMIENIIRQSENNQKLILMEAQNTAHYKHIQQLISNREQVRKMSHDFKQQVQIIYMMCVDRRYDELLEHITVLANKSSNEVLVETKNIMLDSMITSKVEETKQNEIELLKSLDIEPDLDYMTIEICVMIGNALDNAIEACIKSKEDKFIGLEIIATRSQFLCHIKNSVGIKPIIDNGILQTTKVDILCHGVGVQSMIQTCEELGGDLSYEFDDEYFNLWIALSFNE